MLYLVLYVFIHRPEVTECQLSPCPTLNRNGENWENESTTSSAASNTEYTGTEWNTTNFKEGLSGMKDYVVLLVLNANVIFVHVAFDMTIFLWSIPCHNDYPLL